MQRRLSRWHPPLLTITDRSGKQYLGRIKNRRIPVIDAALSPVVATDTIACTDGAAAYARFTKKNTVDHHVLSKKPGRRVTQKAFHIQNVIVIHSRNNDFTGSFKGPASKYLGRTCVGFYSGRRWTAEQSFEGCFRRNELGGRRDMTVDRKAHWDTVYGEKSEAQLSWHQDDPRVSLELIEMAGATANSSVIDIGGGTSRLAGALLAMGLRDITVLDLSQDALDVARDRLGQAGEAVKWISADITTWAADRHYDLWHDRAVFHFLVDAADRAAYLESLARGVNIGGHAIIATFAPDGPEKCSGLPVARYSPSDLAELLGESFELAAHRHHLHQTPSGKSQSFQFSLFRRFG